MNFITPSNITFVIGILVVIFSVYIYFRNPQIDADKTDALLAQQLGRLQLDLTNLRDNHVHTLDMKLDNAMRDMSKIALQVERLSTIIEERIPRKIT